MTEKLYVGLPADVTMVRETLNYAMGIPFPGVNAQTGQPIVDEPTRIAMVAEWENLSPPEKAAFIANPGGTQWAGWSLQWSDLVQEASPGNRRACWIPSDMPTVVQQAGASGRPLSLPQSAALGLAALEAIDDFPGNWIHPD